MSERSVADRRHAGRKAHTNSGRFLSLQADYRAGRLSQEGEERFEAVVLELARIYKGKSM